MFLFRNDARPELKATAAVAAKTGWPARFLRRHPKHTADAHARNAAYGGRRAQGGGNGWVNEWVAGELVAGCD